MPQPVIIEAALNGDTRKSANPNVPVTPEEITADALRCAEAGAATVHFHIEDYSLTGEAAARQYMQAWEPIAEANPDLLVAPTISHGTAEERWSNTEVLVRRGLLKFGPLDPGSLNLPGPVSTADGLPGEKSFVYINSYKDIEFTLAQIDRLKVIANMSIFDANFLRAVLAYEKAGKFKHGAFMKLYFGGDYSMNTGTPGALNFGFRPTRKALEAYLEMLEGSGLVWAVNVFGGDVVDCGLARMALELGGHVRVGLEDFAGERKPTNAELVEEVAELALKIGRPIADPRTAASMMAKT
jgi:uncharacterized protein (DUF849 family)